MVVVVVVVVVVEVMLVVIEMKIMVMIVIEDSWRKSLFKEWSVIERRLREKESGRKGKDCSAKCRSVDQCVCEGESTQTVTLCIHSMNWLNCQLLKMSSASIFCTLSQSSILPNRTHTHFNINLLFSPLYLSGEFVNTFCPFSHQFSLTHLLNLLLLFFFFC